MKRVSKFSLRKYRTAILIGLAALVVMLSFMVVTLLGQLRSLATSDSDNMQWSISQLDLEFANLSLHLSKELSGESTDWDRTKLPVDIALSRLQIVNSGRAAEILKQDPVNLDLLLQVNTYADQIIEIIDRPGEFGPSEVRQVRDLTETLRPLVRKLATSGVSISAENSKKRRAEFSTQLAWTGGTAIVLLLLMGLLLLLLDRLLRRAAQRDAELLVSSKRLSSTISASLDAIIVADTNGKISEFNEAAERIFGWERSDILGQDMADTLVPERRKATFNSGLLDFQNTRTSNFVEQGRFEMSATRKSGEEFPAEINITTVDDKDGLRFVAYIRDISERKINEAKLIDAKNQAQHMDAAKSQFLAFMSHEMRTPLNGLLGVLDLLKTTKLSKKQSRFADIATASSEILLEQVNEALDITRIETGKIVLSPQKFCIEGLLSGLIDTLAPLAAEKGLALSLHVDEAVRFGFDADSGRIRQIVMNLVGNAIKFTEAGHIKVAVTGINGPETTALEIAVIDTGRGIEAQFHEQIFDDFVALADGDHRQRRGDGLGLSISRRIARMMGGDLVVHSDLGQGAKFVLSLALNRSGEASSPREADQNERDQLCDIPGLKILLVEDNKINRSILSEMLRRAGHEIEEACDGVECLTICDAEKFDLILMDISMPTMDGIEATKRLRKGNSPNRNSKIIGITAHGREEYRARALVAGMDDFYTKPIRLTSLSKIVSRPDDQKPNVVASTTMAEIIDVLGRARFESACKEFFDEFDTFLAAAKNSDLSRTQLASEAHKLKGGAAVLGFASLEQALHDVMSRFGEGSDLSIPALLEILIASKKEVQALVKKVIAKHEKTLEMGEA